MSESTPFGIWLKEQRTERGLSLRELARQADLSATYISRLENGQEGCKPSEDTIIKIAHILNRKPSEVFIKAERVPSIVKKALLTDTKLFEDLCNQHKVGE